MNGDTDDSPATRFLAGLIYPPPEIRSIIDKTSSFVARNGQKFEDSLREQQKDNAKFAFLDKDDPYHAYYQDGIRKAKESGGGDTTASPATAASTAAAAVDEAVRAADPGATSATPVAVEKEDLEEIPSYHFLAEPPGALLSSTLDILRLTALWHAKVGPQFLSTLLRRESSNDQFEFLRGGHSLFGYFNRTSDQYRRILSVHGDLEGATNRDVLLRNATDRGATLAYLQRRASRLQRQKVEAAKEEARAQEEKTAFAATDWQDFVVVQTIEFTENEILAVQDGGIALPLPKTLAEVKGTTDEETRLGELLESVRVQGLKQGQAQAVKKAPLPTARAEHPVPERPTQATAVATGATATSLAAREPREEIGPDGIKIRRDYVPKTARPARVMTETCPVCKRAIPMDEMSAHIRVELMDPQYASTRKRLESNRATSNLLQEGNDVTAVLRQLAKPAVEDESSQRKRKEREQAVWDGYSSTADQASGRMQSASIASAEYERQVEAIRRQNGILPGEESNIGPREKKRQ